MSTTVWVVTTYMETDVPHVMRYEAESVREDSFTVASPAGKGCRKQVVRKAVGKTFFTDHGKMMDRCRAWMERRVTQHEQLASSIRRDLLKEDLGIEIIPHGSAIKPKEGG